MKTEATTAQAGTFVQEHPHDAAYAGYQILHWAFVIAPLIAGIDKFFNKLTDWSMYLWAPVGNAVGGAHKAMEIVGAIEIVAAFLVLFKPKIGGLIVMLWLWGIIANLLLGPGFYDIALRDFGLSLGALALSRLASHFEWRVEKSHTEGE
jgi:hypothetical protein